MMSLVRTAAQASSHCPVSGQVALGHVPVGGHEPSGIRLATGGGILGLVVSSHLLDGGVSVVGVELWVEADAPLSSLHEGLQPISAVGLFLCQGVCKVVVRRQPSKFRADSMETVSKLEGLERCPEVAQT